MKTFENKLDELYLEGRQIVSRLIQLFGEKSEHVSEKCLKITDDKLMFNLEGDRYLKEITPERLIDNSGYAYDIDVLDYDQFFKIIDFVIEEYES